MSQNQFWPIRTIYFMIYFKRHKKCFSKQKTSRWNYFLVKNVAEGIWRSIVHLAGGNPLTFVKDQRETSMALYTLLDFTLFHLVARAKYLK